MRWSCRTHGYDMCRGCVKHHMTNSPPLLGDKDRIATVPSAAFSVCLLYGLLLYQLLLSTVLAYDKSE